MMLRRSIGFRLAVWYSCVMAIALIAFGVAMTLGMRRSLYGAIDNALRDRVRDTARVVEQFAPSLAPAELQDEIEEHLSLEPGGDLLRIFDADGAVLYASRPLSRGRFPVYTAADLAGGSRYEDARARREPLRFLTSSANVAGREIVIQAAVPLREWIEGLSHFVLILAASIPFALAIAGLGGYWMSRRALAPVDSIISAARTIDADDLSQRLAVPRTGDELERLSTTLNHMFERLQASFNRVTQFTADASHELRTPLALMTTTAELALRKSRPVEQYQAALGQILTELERTSGLVENLLLLARADSGTRARFRRVDLTAAFQDACEQGRAIAGNNGVRFGSSQPNRAVEVEGDFDSLRRVLLILVDNAVKYTPAQGEVRLDLMVTGASAMAVVTDSGCGIAADDLPHIFDRFYRADPARSAETGGAGLGLAIAQWIVHAHRGEIAVSSKPGEGSVFTVKLPLTG
jgi:heavy metal sensor kinase